MSQSRRILVVDDVEQNVALLGGMVRSLGYEVTPASDGLEALRQLAGVDLVLLDVMMPGLDGFEVTRRVRADPATRDLPIILVTVLDSREDRVKGVEAGASDFIAKPVDKTELGVRVSSQLRLKQAQDDLKRGQAELEDRVARRTEELRRACAEVIEANRRTSAAHVDTMKRLVLAAELKDPDTARHIVRMSRYSAVLARALRMSAPETEALGHAVMMHDVGKIGIPDAILRKRGALDPAERAIMESHTLIGGRILAGSRSDLMRNGRVVALTHHERWDGSGYPRRLSGEQIPLAGRICAIVDVFDAMTTARPYRSAIPTETVLEEMRLGRGRHFDPWLLDLFMARLPEVFALQARMREEGAGEAGGAGRAGTVGPVEAVGSVGSVGSGGLLTISTEMVQHC
ncbi:MAG TPA: HD domain-containing phosphohydrolase [Thermoanaerobaculia bacterium]|nr:HD domain-containing phosphohydrolase [Thermoanaerobaculia bacterium]